MKQSFRAEREFGLIVGGILTLLAAWWFYRGKFESYAPWVLAVGILLVLLGIILPRALIYPNRFWLGIGRLLAAITSPIILGVIFFIVMTPIALVKRLMGWDPLDRRSAARNTYWIPYESYQQDKRHYEKMY